MNFSLNSNGRVFIQETPCSVFEYSEDCGIEVAGISESYGDITNIYCASSTTANGYEIKAQVEGAEASPTTTITGYLPADGYSQLMQLAKKKCTFNMIIKYGECSNPTDFNDFDYALVFEGVRITSSSTTNLTSRSPDTRSVIDLTFSVTIKKVYDLFKPTFVSKATATELGNGGIVNMFAYNEGECGSSGCEDSCVLLGLQLRNSNTFRFVRYVDDTWVNSAIAAGITQYAADSAFIYTDGVTVYAVVSVSPNELRVYSAPYSNIASSSLTFTQIYSVSGNTVPRYYEYGGKLYFAVNNGTTTQLGVLTLSSGSVSVYGSGTIGANITSVFGYGGSVYIGTDSGGFFRFKNDTILSYSSSSPATTSIMGVAVHDENNFKILADNTSIYCTTNGGTSWKSMGSIGTVHYPTQLNDALPWQQILVNTTNNSVFISYDGGLSYVSDTTLDSETLLPTGVTFCGDKIYISARESDNSSGGIFENKR
jgi:hypothetical protein